MSETITEQKPSMSQETVMETTPTVITNEPVQTEKVIDVKPAPSEPVTLSAEQEKKLVQCEATIGNHAKSFYQVGLALKDIRDEKLHLAFDSFEKYCQQKWEMGSSHAYRLIDAAIVMDKLTKELPKEVPLPSNEGQVRPLAELKPRRWVEVWKQVVEAAGEKPITAKLVETTIGTRQPAESESTTGKKNGKKSSSIAKRVNSILSLVSTAKAKAKSDTVSQVKTLLKRIELKLKKLKAA
jgi:hypothetical protein